MSALGRSRPCVPPGRGTRSTTLETGLCFSATQSPLIPILRPPLHDDVDTFLNDPLVVEVGVRVCVAPEVVHDAAPLFFDCESCLFVHLFRVRVRCFWRASSSDALLIDVP